MDPKTLLLPEKFETRCITGPENVRVADDGTFEGFACRWGVRDDYGTAFLAGAFTAGGLDSEPYPLLWMHDVRTVLGAFTAEEQDEGLWIAGAYDPTTDGQEARARAKSGSAPELSVGFNITAVDPTDQTLIAGAVLFETSQVTARMAAQRGAALSGVRTGMAIGGTEATLTVEQGAVAARLRLTGL